MTRTNATEMGMPKMSDAEIKHMRKHDEICRANAAKRQESVMDERYLEEWLDNLMPAAKASTESFDFNPTR